MPMFTTARMRSPVAPRPVARCGPGRRTPLIRSSTACTSATTSWPSTSIGASRGARSATCSAARSSVTLMRSPANIASIRSRHAGPLGERDQQARASRRSRGASSSRGRDRRLPPTCGSRACGIVGEEVAQVRSSASRRRAPRAPPTPATVGAVVHHVGAFSSCPPNCLRIAESTRFANSASPRDSNRSNSAADNTWTGTPSSTAASSVQRPSPESLTRPWNPSRSDRPAAPPRSGRGATIRRRCRGATPRRPRRCRCRSGSTRARAAAWSRRRPRAPALPAFACVQDVETLGVGGHEPVLDAVVHHLHEVAGPDRPAVQVAGSAVPRVDGSRPGVRGAASTPGRQRGEDRVEARDGLVARRRSSCRTRGRDRTPRRSCRRRRSACRCSRDGDARATSSR